jgi:hypothetical protein
LSKIKKYFQTFTDLGNHWTKAYVEGFDYLRFPSYYATCVESTSNKIVGHVRYLEGGRTDLIGQCWVIGEQAARTDSNHCIRLVDNYNGKSTLYLEYFLGILAHLPQINAEQYHKVTVTCNDVKRHKPEILSKVAGLHKLELRGVKAEVQIEILDVLPEGVASLRYNKMAKGNVTVCDIGGGNVTLSRFSDSELVNNPKPEDFGVQWLLTELMGNSDLKKLLNHPPSLEVINRAIESPKKNKEVEKNQIRVLYGDKDITDIYLTELNRFIDCKMRPVLKQLTTAKQQGDTVLVIGGGAKLPYLAEAMTGKGFMVSKSGEWDNLKGLVEVNQ